MKKLVMAVLALALIASLGFAAEGPGGEYPSRDITFIIGFGAGGGTDTTGRLFITALEKQIPEVNLVPTNMAGAGGTVGATHVFNSDPNGYTFFIAHPGIPVPHLRGNFDYTYEDFSPVCSFADSTIAMYVQGDSPYMSVDDITDAAKSEELIMGVSIGTMIHLASLHMETEKGAEFKKVSVGGGTPAPPELLAGRVDTILQSVAAGAPYVDSGDFRALAVYGDRRIWPDVPTFAELGYPFKFQQTFGLWAPPGTPPEIIDYLSAAAEKACEDPEYVEALAALQVRSGYRDTNDYLALLDESFAELEQVAPLLLQ